ncbi:sigma-70 family RNA polymerase sigma factor [Conexibacter sp. JD483]|uniref:sigma-70 family RNA polymerase sigma factor n=1 Tax=unclassified Conexibacter TaxID=2627773 RepID=UPI0027274615|nr:MULTISPECIES: sigma-70 family RNA polymerase sigma factor [unclassified Conexibacter]MDO8189007.1 sigma-70 family RNA polymerase sigma factor [Conexibacter sp. CPCC 205706]MDO8201407.1 sigma-70 family RNA polymerase sigma factor [Conexibacter sp. CPCC 205762]MDR9371706.1 sigma-70 family RNA polymerase sigma factor [Conexibacter sp. JD483]
MARPSPPQPARAARLICAARSPCDCSARRAGTPLRTARASSQRPARRCCQAGRDALARRAWIRPPECSIPSPRELPHESGHRFGAYAIPTITGELRRHFRDTTWAVHVPRGMQEDALRVRKATQALTERGGRAPTVGELCAETGLDAEQVAEALQAQFARETSSIERPVGGGDGDDDGLLLGDTLGDEDGGFDLVEHRASIAPLLAALRPSERELLFLRFGRELTQTQIAAHFGCSQMHVSRVLRRVLDRLGAAERAALRAGEPAR